MCGSINLIMLDCIMLFDHILVLECIHLVLVLIEIKWKWRVETFLIHVTAFNTDVVVYSSSLQQNSEILRQAKSTENYYHLE